jgi:hypothetical protein
MKIHVPLLVMALGIASVAFQATAAPPTFVTLATSTTNTPSATGSQLQPQMTTQKSPPATPSATTVTPKSKFYWFTPAPTKMQTQVQWYGGTSTRPWGAPEWHPGQTQFPDAENHQSQLVLIGFDW